LKNNLSGSLAGNAGFEITGLRKYVFIWVKTPVMTNYIIRTTNLNYSYGSRRVLADVSLAVPAGSIFGFLGLNGSGKTTTIRLLLGINDAHGQHIALFGQGIAGQKLEILKRVGALIETPVLYPHLSGHCNMEIARLARNASKEEVDRVLDMVGIKMTRVAWLKPTRWACVSDWGLHWHCWAIPSF
jgi:ABC-type multidrug transport system ATPase subunit